MALADVLLHPVRTARQAVHSFRTKNNPIWSAMLEELMLSRMFAGKGAEPVEQDFAAFVNSTGLFSWVEACTRAISRSAAGVPWGARGGSGDIDFEHPLIQRLNRPNDTMSGWELRILSDLAILVAGNAYWILDDGSGNPPSLTSMSDVQNLEIWFARPDKMRVVPSTSSAFPIEGYEFTNASGKVVPLDVGQVIHFREPNIRDPLYGLSRLRQLERTLRLMHEAYGWNEDMFRNGMRISGIVKAPAGGMMSDAQMARVKAELNSAHVGQGKRHSTLFIGAADFVEAGMNMREAEFTKLLGMLREEVHAVFGVPPVQTGLMEYAAYATARQQDQQFYRGTVIPQNEIKSERLNSHPLTTIFGVKVVFDYSRIEALKEDTRAAAAIDQGNVDRGIETINEIREKRDYGQALPWGDIPPFLRPVAPTTEPGAPGDTPAAPGGGGGGGNSVGFERAPDPEMALAAIEPVPGEWIGKNAPKEKAERTRIVRTVSSRILRLHGLWEAAARRAARAGKTEALRLLHLAAPKGSDAVGHALIALDYTAGLHRSANAEFRAPARATYKLGVRDASEIVASGAKKAASYVVNVDGPKAREFLGQWVNEATDAVTATQRQALMDLVEEAATEGLTVRELAGQIGEHFDDLAGSWAERIARTETGGLYNAGSLDVYKEAGIEEHEWLTAEDDRVRPDHEAMDGVVVALGENFVLPDGSRGEYPGAIDDVGQVCNCRCVTRPIFTNTGD